jgi:hypothetical protein
MSDSLLDNGGALSFVVGPSPSLESNEPFNPLDHLDVAVAVIDTIERLAHAKREGDSEALEYAATWFDQIPGLREAVRQAANGKTYTAIQCANQAKKAGANRRRNELMAGEYLKRELQYALRGESISFTALAAQIGRLPQFRLRRNAAGTAIRDGLKYLGRSIVQFPRHPVQQT